MFTIDAALEHTCAEFRARADCGQITAAERDLLIDGAILLAVKLEELIQDSRGKLVGSWPEAAQPQLVPA